MVTAFILCLLSQNPLAPPDPVLVAAPPVAPAPPPAPPPVALSVPTAPAPEFWDLKDSRGEVWRHADREYLKAWVAGRNYVLDQSQVAQIQTPVQTQQPQYQLQTQVQTQPRIQYTYNQPQYGYQQQVQPRACQGASLQSLRNFYAAPQR